MRWSEDVRQADAESSSVITQTYSASALLTLDGNAVDGWTISGHADVAGTYTSDYRSETTTPFGPCKVHYTDDASGQSTVAIDDGGLEARDSLYQFYVNIAGYEGGGNDTVRDDSGCFGSKTSENTQWSIAPTTVGGSGDYDGSGHLSGSHSEPRQGGQYTVTWDFTLDD